jgi:hypothetical protein
MGGVRGMEEESESFGGGEDWKSTQLVCFRAATELQVKSGYCSSRASTQSRRTWPTREAEGTGQATAACSTVRSDLSLAAKNHRH